jgi:hypothetical protein
MDKFQVQKPTFQQIQSRGVAATRVSNQTPLALRKLFIATDKPAF